MKRTIYFYIAGIVMLVSCGKSEKPADAFGNFEAREYTVSSESNGKIIQCAVTDGDPVEAMEVLAITDTVDLNLRKAQVISQRASVSGKAVSLQAQKGVYEQQIANLTKDQVRLSRMIKDGAATQKQLDDVDGAILLAKRQIEAVDAQFGPLREEVDALSRQIDQIGESILHCSVKAPVSGVILEAYVRQGEFVNVGKPMFKMADLSELDLRVFVSGDQLASFKIGQQVNVYIDGDNEALQRTGTVVWVSSEAEFTPKTIQTREERVNLVYAVKVRVKNDGGLKIGMPGEVRL